MRQIALFCMVGCGAPIYFPVEPPPFVSDSASPDTSDTGPGDTGSTTTVDTVDTGDTTPSTPTVGGLPCSFYGWFGATLTVRNTGTRDLSLYWRDFYCVEHFYGTVTPGVDFVQGSYENQAWVVRDPYGPTVSSIVIHEEQVLWEVP